MTYLNLLYEARTNTIDDVLKSAQPLRKARKNLRKAYGDSLQIEIGLDVKRYDGDIFVIWCVAMDGNQKTLETAVKDCIDEAGIPKRVDSFLNWGFVEKILKEYGKKLKKKYLGFMPAEVVDA
ncbi:MAG TPA: hypothetical protein VJI46_01950 [Candidatus Nanoarchaeia archaeon]|nr:hypothetical protein [Candidatus Nanoarchaeia archaeon]